MPKTLYCWRCQMHIPMLTEDEWALIEPHLNNPLEQIKAYRKEHHCSLAEANLKLGQRALDLYQEITGFKELNAPALFHHRISIYGPPCHACGKPLRTPKASYCVACGVNRQ